VEARHCGGRWSRQGTSTIVIGEEGVHAVVVVGAEGGSQEAMDSEGTSTPLWQHKKERLEGSRTRALTTQFDENMSVF
jgi:hypothetical protein